MIRTLLNHSIVYGLTHTAARGTLLVSLLVLPAILAPADYGALAMLTLAGCWLVSDAPPTPSRCRRRWYAAKASAWRPDR